MKTTAALTALIATGIIAVPIASASDLTVTVEGISKAQGDAGGVRH